jgi:hypothetical protein
VFICLCVTACLCTTAIDTRFLDYWRWNQDSVLIIVLLNSTCLFETEEGLIVTCQDLFTAGGDTTDNTLGFCLLYMVLHPHVQSAVQRELDSVVGRERRPSIEDKQRLVSTRSMS